MRWAATAGQGLWLVALATVAAFTIALLLTPVVRRLAERWGMVDEPEGRRVNVEPVPRAGGLATMTSFVAVAVVAVAINGVLKVIPVPAELGSLGLLALLGGGVAAALLGLADDYLQLRARWQLLGQLVLAGWAIVLGIGVDTLNTPFGNTIHLEGIVEVVFTAFWIVGMINAINFIDGLDGLSSGIGLIAAVTLGTISLTVTVGQPFITLLCFILAGALFGFLRWNFHPASVFAGTSGVMFLGYTLAILSILGTAKVAVALLVLGVPIIDTFWIIVRRVSSGGTPFTPDRGHIHHRLLDLGLSHRQAVLAIYGMCLALAVLSLGLSGTGQVYAFLGLFVALGVLLFVLTRRSLIAEELSAESYDGRERVAQTPDGSGSREVAGPPTAVDPARRHVVGTGQPGVDRAPAPKGGGSPAAPAEDVAPRSEPDAAVADGVRGTTAPRRCRVTRRRAAGRAEMGSVSGDRDPDPLGGADSPEPPSPEPPPPGPPPAAGPPPTAGLPPAGGPQGPRVVQPVRIVLAGERRREQRAGQGVGPDARTSPSSAGAEVGDDPQTSGIRPSIRLRRDTGVVLLLVASALLVLTSLSRGSGGGQVLDLTGTPVALPSSSIPPGSSAADASPGLASPLSAAGSSVLPSLSPGVGSASPGGSAAATGGSVAATAGTQVTPRPATTPRPTATPVRTPAPTPRPTTTTAPSATPVPSAPAGASPTPTASSSSAPSPSSPSPTPAPSASPSPS